jgi:hypothetical protein
MIRTTGYFLWCLCRILCGFALLGLGIFLSIPGIPGPGIVFIVLGFGVLSPHFYWAHRAHMYTKQLWQEILDRRKNAAAKRETDHG